MLNVPLNIVLHSNQELIFDSKALNVVVKAGKRFGKTKLAVYKLVKEAGKTENGIFWYIAKTYGWAEDIAWREFNSMIPKEYIRRKNENDLSIVLVSGSEIRLKGAENQNALRGPKLNGIVLDEAAYMNKYIWNNILRGQLLGNKGDKPGFAFFISSPINPLETIGKDITDWYPRFHEEAMRKKKLGDVNWDAYHFTIYDNPTLEKGQIDEIKNDSTDDEWNVEYMANESSLAGTIYNEFQFDRDVVEYQVSGSSVLVRGHDWGIDHPTVCLFANVDNERKIVYFEDEYVQSGYTIEESVNVINKKTTNRVIAWDVCDPSMNKRNSQTKRTDKDEYARLGIPCIGGDNSNRGYNIVKMFFKKGMIRIHPKCKTLIKQLRDLQWSDTVGDDCPDVLRYICVRVHDFMFKWKDVEKEKEKPFTRKPFSLNDKNLFHGAWEKSSSKIIQEIRSY